VKACPILKWSSEEMLMKFSPFQNAKDSLETAIEIAAYESHRHESTQIKQAIQAIAHSIELLIKERLRRIHPAFLWEKVENYPSLDARTVTVDMAIQRLFSVGAIELHAADKLLLEKLRKKRNKIEHYAFDVDPSSEWPLILESLAFAIEFINQHLCTYYIDNLDSEEKLLQDLHAKKPSLASIIEQRKSRPATIRKEICSECRAASLLVDESTCSLCGHYDHKRWDAILSRQEHDPESLPF
jgi:hypothetical protein